ncbi:hypothetical protein ACFQV2_39640 [Actinokineospora soli]|uniref:Uncharacterized protein n=1 Tax=Actinokineospora soli TaxID=1048753 RepID=A0ABW2TZ80_9PSEU
MGLTEWAQPGERVQAQVRAKLRDVGSRIAGTVRAPHPVPDDAPATVEIKQDHPLPAEWTAAGGWTGFDWVEDDAIGWWAEAADPRQDAARAADFLAAGCGQAGLFLTDRRIAVVLPEKLLAEVRAAARAKKGLLGRAVDGLLESTSWDLADKVVSIWEADARRLRGWGVALVGRGFPFARVARFDFADGSVLFGRTHGNDVLLTKSR